ncbi:4'-phosphopantetheinyl transferase [Ramaria rubella]|nr:4'-phosphopantetheinyl transferase [Ramaria rubella]
MTILGVGTDVLYLPRMAALVKRRSAGRLASRILCEREHGHWVSLQNHNDQLRFLAVRWCVKEAAYKALQPDLALGWKDISFLKDPILTNRKPVLHMIRECTWTVKFHASVSHDGDYVIAMVVAENAAISGCELSS